MLTPEQVQELEALVSEMEANEALEADIQAAVDARKAEMLASNKPKEVVEEEVIEEKVVEGNKLEDVNLTVEEDVFSVDDEIVKQEKLNSEEANELFSSTWAEDNQVLLGGNLNTPGTYVDPVNDERSEAIEEAIELIKTQNGGTNLLQPSEEEILSQAKDIWVKNKNKDVEKDFIQNKLKDENAIEWSSVQTWKGFSKLALGMPSGVGDIKFDEEAARFTQERTKITKEDTKNKLEGIEKYNKEIETIKSSIKINELKAIDLGSTDYNNQEDLDKAKEQLKNLFIENQALQNKGLEIFNEIGDSKESLTKNAEILDVLKRDYSAAGSLISLISAATVDIANTTALAIPKWLKTAIPKVISEISPNAYIEKGLTVAATSLAGPLGKLIYGEKTDEARDKVSGFLKNISDNIREDVATPTEFQDLDSGGKVGLWLANLVGNQLPNLAVMAAAPAASLYVLGASAAGGKFLDMEEEMNLPNGVDYSGMELLFAPAIVGVAEFASERITLGQVKGVMNAFKGDQSVKAAAKDYLTNSYLKWAKDMFKEGGSEVAATLSENMVDKYMLGKDIDLTRGLTESFASGAVMSGFMYKAPLAGRALKNIFFGEDTRSQITNGNNLIKQISEELNNENLTLKEREELLETQKEITLKQGKIMRNANEGWDNLTNAERKRLFNVYTLQDNIKKRAEKIANNPKTSEENKQNNLTIQGAKWDSLQNEKNRILTKASEKNFDPQSFALEQYEYNVTKGRMGLKEYTTKKIIELSDREKVLIERRSKEKDSKEREYISLQIKNVQDQLKYVVPKAMGFATFTGTTIAKAKSVIDLSKAFVTKSTELRESFNKNEITPDQYDAQYKKIKKAFDLKRASFVEKSKTDKKGESYTELQDLYDASLDENGKLKNDTKTVNSFKKKVGAIVESATKRLFDGVPVSERLTDRAGFVENLSNDAWLLVRDEFDPSIQSLDRFISNRLNLRANRSVKKSAKQEGFTESISENPNLGSTILNDVVEEQEAREALEVAKALQIPDSIVGKAKAAAVSILSTISNKVDAVKFKSEIANAFKDVLYTDLKNLFGKDTKTNKAFTETLKKNIRPFYDVLTVESMRKARNNKTGINPFVELGLLDNDGNKVTFENIDQQAVIDFYTKVDNTVKGNAQKLSDRRMNLIEAVASSLGAAQAIDLLNNDAGVREKFLSRQAQENETAKKGLDLLVPKAFVGYINTLKELAQAKTINSVAKLLGIKDITVSNVNRTEKQQSALDAIEKFGLTPNVFEAAMPASSGAVRSRDSKGDVYYELSNGKKIIGSRPAAGLLQVDKNGKKIFNLPTLKSIENEFGNNVTLVASRGRLYYGKSDQAYIDALTAAEKNLKGKKELKPQRVLNNFFSESAQSRSDVNMDILEDVAIQLNDAVKAGMPKEIAALIIAQGYQATGGLIKIAAKFKYKSKTFEFGIKKFFQKNKNDRSFREEHNPPASLIGANLIWAISNDKVRDLMPYIRKNYYQTQLSKRDDERLDLAGFGGTLPQGSTILDNPIVRLAQAGTEGNRIDLNSIINPLTGKTIAQENNVESASTPDAVAASNSAAVANNVDQVENLLDRAIAKLTELTGDNGTLQMNFGAIPVNVLIGGLRATKLAYQGGKSMLDAINSGYNSVKKYMSEAEWTNFVGKATYEVRNENNSAQVKLSIMNEKGIAQMQEQVRQGNYSLLKEFGVDIDGLTTDEIIEKINILRKAKVVGSNTKAPKKKARVFDFDDTLAKTNSNVLYTLPDGTTGSLDATQFAEQFSELQEAGATFDYSEFSQVKDGSKGPLATLAKRFTEAKGDRDVFVLTARPADAALAIQEFLRATLGISIPLQNITGLANGKPGAKAMWVAEKVSEGYNDVFFADDVAANVKAVADMLDNLGVTKRVQQAKESGQRGLEDEMDSLIRGKKRSKIGKFLSKINIYIPPGADDFAGLLKYFQAKGKLGDEQMKWFQDNLLTPFAQGISAYTSAKVALADDFTALNKRFKNGRTLGIPSKFRKMLSQEVLGGIYTNEQAVRAYLYDKAGEDLGLNKADTQDLIALVEGNGELKAYADALSKITKLDTGYPPITEQWLGGSIATDMAVVSNKAQRAEFLQEFTNNKEQIFSDQNMKLIKQIYGNDYADALSNILERMETGQNRKKGKDKEFNSAMNWINQSVGAVMAINMRSAILQQMSIVNYMNWNFNNPIKMGMAMANVPRFMKDYLMILNSDFLKERRGGMAIEVNLADIADSNPGNLFLRLNKKVLELGFKPTQWGDSNAIAFGGATWYRNRYNQLIEQGVSESEANSQAMLEFQEVSETAQQSSRVDKVSRQQASDIGRLILAFANTPLQYARETRKATSDLVNGRGDWKTNASKILYYGVAQNIIFTALQQGLFALLLSDADDEEYEKTDKKLMYSLNGVADGMLRGMGYAGAVVAALKNLGMEYYDQRQKREKGERVYDGSLKLVQRGLSISPPISKKIGDIVEGQKFETWKQYKNDPFYQGFAYANYFSGLTNLPADRIFKKIENLKAASQDSTEAWQSVFLALGWSPYNVGVDIEYNIPYSTYNSRKSNARTRPQRKQPQRKRSKRSPVPDKLPEGVLGRANKDGTMDIKPGLSAEKRKKVIAHEQVHLDQFKSGKLDYTDSDITWKGQKIPRTADSKIFYNGKLYIEGAKSLPWEKEANKLSKNKV